MTSGNPIEVALELAGVEFIDENGGGLECVSRSRPQPKPTNRSRIGMNRRTACLSGPVTRPSCRMKLVERSSGSTSPRLPRQ